MIKIDRGIIIKNNCLDPVKYIFCSGPFDFHSMCQFACTKPPLEHIKKMNSMLDKNTAALLPIPEPMAFRELFIACIVFKKPMNKLAHPFLINDLLHYCVQWIIALHKIYRIK